MHGPIFPGTMHLAWRFHPERDRLLAEAHARPSTPVLAPQLATRIASMSGEGGLDLDRAHMAALCRKLGTSEPGPDARWGLLDGGRWRLRWERHTELSTWTFFRDADDADSAPFSATALDLVPQDWLAGLPGDVMAAAHVSIVATLPKSLPFADADIVGSAVAGSKLTVVTDFRPGPDDFTRFIVATMDSSPATTGRVLQQLFEIETYRLLALLAFPLAQATSAPLAQLEADAAAAALRVTEGGGVEADRQLLNQLAVLAGRAEALVGTTSFRFAASRAYHGLVLERIGQLRETTLQGRPTIADFMERRLNPAMRTCGSVAERQHEVIERIARTTQMLSTRVDVASEAINEGLLASMDKRSRTQLRLQQTVEGLSVVAIAYYALGLLKFFMDGLARSIPTLDATLATGLAAPVVVGAVWLLIQRIKKQLEQD